ncbi:MAG: hypothetical protein LBT68_08120 [Spirochaetales bacterium]|nr:hypothetical protein [Spirochaetales bacterium]
MEEEALPDAGFSMLIPELIQEEIALSEPVPEAEADISWERRDAPGEPDFPIDGVSLAEAENPGALPDSLAENSTENAIENTIENPPANPSETPAQSAQQQPADSGVTAAPAPAIPAPLTPPVVPVVPPPAPVPVPQKPAADSGQSSIAAAGPIVPSAGPDNNADYFPPSGGAATIIAGPSRRMSGIVGQTITVTLPGINWIYMPDEADAGKIRYIGKIVEDGSTVFSFSPFEKGDYELKFQQQDLAANTLRYDDVRLAVDPASGTQTGEPSSDTAAANPAASGTQQQPDVAPPVAAQSPAPEAAAASSTETPAPVTVTAPVDEPEAEKLKKLAQDGRADALAELEKYVAGHEAEFEGLDEWYFFLAQMFEKDSPARDMKKALAYYEKVRDLFPISSRWPASDVKSRYIRLNYFDIR